MHKSWIFQEKVFFYFLIIWKCISTLCKWPISYEYISCICLLVKTVACVLSLRWQIYCWMGYGMTVISVAVQRQQTVRCLSGCSALPSTGCLRVYEACAPTIFWVIHVWNFISLWYIQNVWSSCQCPLFFFCACFLPVRSLGLVTCFSWFDLEANAFKRL